MGWMSIRTPIDLKGAVMKFVEEFTFNAKVAAPIPVGDGPYGPRTIYEIIGGNVTGDRIHGKVLASNELEPFSQGCYGDAAISEAWEVFNAIYPCGLPEHHVVNRPNVGKEVNGRA